MFTIDIEKSKIVEIWNNNHSKVLQYTQMVKNSESNISKNIVSDDLNGLLSKVRTQIGEWKNYDDTH